MQTTTNMFNLSPLNAELASYDRYYWQWFDTCGLLGHAHRLARSRWVRHSQRVRG